MAPKYKAGGGELYNWDYEGFIEVFNPVDKPRGPGGFIFFGGLICITRGISFDVFLAICLSHEPFSQQYSKAYVDEEKAAQASKQGLWAIPLFNTCPTPPDLRV